MGDIPISWIKRYGKENGPEVKEILDYMISEYKAEQREKG